MFAYHVYVQNLIMSIIIMITTVVLVQQYSVEYSERAKVETSVVIISQS